MKVGGFVIVIKRPKETGKACTETIWATSGAWELPAGYLLGTGLWRVLNGRQIQSELLDLSHNQFENSGLSLAVSHPSSPQRNGGLCRGGQVGLKMLPPDSSAPGVN